MKYFLIIGLGILVSCSSKAPELNTPTKVVEEIPTPKKTSNTKPKKETILLCKVNGVDWFYTKKRSRKIMSTGGTPRKKFAFNFTNENTIPQEQFTLMFNADNNQLEFIDMSFANPETKKKQFVGIKPFTPAEISTLEDIGRITDVSENRVSGVASFTVPADAKGIYTNGLGKDVVISDLKFENIEFEDESN